MSSCSFNRDVILSIIIPCYNSEKFISRTLDCLFSQDYNHCEVICVNDGSSDDTLSVIQQYVTLYPLTIINQSNKGVSSARNAGLQLAKGAYIYFLDSDDILPSGTLQFFKERIAANPCCDFFAWGYEKLMNGKISKRYVYPELDNQVFSGLQLLQLFLIKKFCTNICSCICSSTLLRQNKIFFKEGVRIGEDVMFLMNVLMQSKQAFYAKRVCFQYLLRNDSTMQGYKSYSKAQYNSFTLIKNLLSSLAVEQPQYLLSVNFFLAFFFISNLRYYLLSDVVSSDINEMFDQDKVVLTQPISKENHTIWLGVYLFRFIPLSLLLRCFRKL